MIGTTWDKSRSRKVGNYYVIITIENEDGRVVDEFTSNTVRFVYTAQP